MFSLIIARALISAVKTAARPFHELRIATDLWAGAARGEEKIAVKLQFVSADGARTLEEVDLFLTEESALRIFRTPTVVQGGEEATALKKTGTWPGTTS